MEAMEKNKPTQHDVEQVEEKVGMGHNAWDCVDPMELVAAAWDVQFTLDERRTIWTVLRGSSNTDIQKLAEKFRWQE